MHILVEKNSVCVYACVYACINGNQIRFFHQFNTDISI